MYGNFSSKRSFVVRFAHSQRCDKVTELRVRMVDSAADDDDDHDDVQHSAHQLMQTDSLPDIVGDHAYSFEHTNRGYSRSVSFLWLRDGHIRFYLKCGLQIRITINQHIPSIASMQYRKNKSHEKLQIVIRRTATREKKSEIAQCARLAFVC